MGCFGESLERRPESETSSMLRLPTKTAAPEDKSEERLYGQVPYFPRLQTEAAGADPKRPAPPWAICDTGLPGPLGGTDAADQARKLEFRASARWIPPRQMELGGVRGATADHDQEGHSLCHQMVEIRYHLAGRDL